MSPHLSDKGIQQMKQELIELIGPHSTENRTSTTEKREQAMPSKKENPAALNCSENPYIKENSPNTTTEPTQTAEPPTTDTSNSSYQDTADPEKEKHAVPAAPSIGIFKEAPTSISDATNKCFSCGRSRLQSAYTASQRKQPAGTRRCIDCREKESPAPNAPSVLDDDAQKKNSQPMPDIAVSASQYVKQCFECHKPKPQIGFTASQWKKRLGTGKCIDCVSNTIQWKTSSIGSSLQMKACGECNKSKPHAEFSPNQWRKSHGTGRCKECVQTSLPYGG
mmetsp:Transcript_1899/g.4113  ORF Transcript_1899/g.4113 Transcript_1899/m.4113 type:complete len:279 (+) Transcript_1899:175-1011(+)